MALFSTYATELLSRTTLPQRGESVDCAVSGGPDSLALLVLSVAKGCDTVAYHVDHGIRAGSSDEALVVKAAADRLGARFVSLRVECAPGPNLEARARAARYAAMPKGVATGHTADDQAETILLNLLRGAGIDGLSGMLADASHPILSLRRHETERLVSSMNLEVVRDPSNNDQRFRRNRVRHELIPLAAAIAERDIVPILCRQAGLLRDDAELLDALSSDLDPAAAGALRDAPRPLARRALRRWLRGITPDGQPPDAAALERVLSVASGEHLAAEIAGGSRIRRSKGRLIADLLTRE